MEKKNEFGDFQTPIELAKEIVEFLKARGVSPCAVLEPTCGLGSFLVSSIV